MNKKIVFIITLVECVLAVLFISVFGQAIFSITKKDVTDVYFVYENGEKIEDTARRELYEETGAVKFKLELVCVYSVTGKNRVNEEGNETFGKLFFAEIESFEHELHSEIEYIEFFENFECR